MVVLKLCMVLKEILISKRAIASENSKELELEKEKINSRTVPINSLAVPEKRQELIEINNGEIVEVWTIIDPKDQKYQIFTTEEIKKEEKAVPDIVYLRVVPMVINSIGEEEVLLNSRLYHKWPLTDL